MRRQRAGRRERGDRAAARRAGPRPRPILRAHRAVGRAGAEFSQGHDAGGERFREAGDEAFAPVRGREVVDKFILAAEMARICIAAVAGDVFEGEVGAAHELVGFLDAEAAEGGLRAHVADLREEPAEETEGNMNRVGDFFHRRAAGEVFGIPGEGALDFEVGEIGERGGLELGAVGEGEGGEVHESALEKKRTQEAGCAEVGLEFGRDLLEADDVGVGEFLGKPAALTDNFAEGKGRTAEVKHDAVKRVMAVVGPSVGAFGGEDPEGFFGEDGALAVAEDRAAATVDHGVEFPICAGVARHRVFPTDASVCEVA